jgi:hypothetical protein
VRVPFRTRTRFPHRRSIITVNKISLGGGVKANTLRAGNDANRTRESQQRVFADKSVRAKSVERLRNPDWTETPPSVAAKPTTHLILGMPFIILLASLGGFVSWRRIVLQRQQVRPAQPSCA